ncbi:MAG TPA: hypothetical protein P5079_11475, partial [Elusimicrobiota bacterium]|nr:hypothetical protein [Elusimicrobiota bacterium]
NNGIFEPAIDITSVSRLSQGTEKFTSNAATITLTTPEVIYSSAAGQYFFVTYDISNLAQVGRTLGLSIGTSHYVTVGVPDRVNYVLTSDSDFGTITEAADNVVLGVRDLAGDLVTGNGVKQGSVNIPFLQFSLQTDVSQAEFQAIRVERIGSSNVNPLLPEGSNSDVAAIRVWDDANFNLKFDAGDTLISVGTNTFNQAVEADKQKEIAITTSPAVVIGKGAPRVFFLTYDISNSAAATNTVGVKVVDQNAVTMSAPNGMVGYYQDLVTKTTYLYSFEGSRVTINPILIQISAESMVPAAVSQLTQNVPVLKMKMHTDVNYAILNAINLQQIGTVESPLTIGQGQGDFSRAAIWLDNGDDIFVAAQDTFLGAAVHGTADFTGGVARVPLGTGFTLPITTTTFFVTADIGETDVTGGQTVNHTAGFSLTGLSQITRVPSTSQDYPSNEYPLRSGVLSILKFGLPRVPFITLLPKIWADYDRDYYPDVDTNGNGRLDESEKTSNPSYPRDAEGRPIVTVPGIGVTASDLDGDGRTNDLDIDGDGMPDLDIDGDGLIEFDINSDGKADNILQDLNGDGVPEVDLSRDGTVNWGILPEKWTNETTKLFCRWPSISATVTEYQVGVGERPDSKNAAVFNSETFNLSPNDGWISAGARNYFTVTNIGMSAARVTRTVTASVGRLLEPPFTLFVQNADGFDGEGEIYIGSEIMRYSTRDQGSFVIVARGLYSTEEQDHPIGQRVTNNGFFYNVRAMGETNEGPGAPVAVYRVDSTAPSAPTAPISEPEQTKKPAELGKYEIKWDPSSDAESGVREYEIQERQDNDPVWRTVDYVPANRVSYIIGEGKVAGDPARP